MSSAEHSTHVHRDDYGAKMGMWLFLFTELILFGGLFLIYAVYRFMYPHEFHIAAMDLNTFLGAVNTIILLTSSLTIALSITALQKNKKNLSLLLQFVTILFALAFMVNKYFEWGAKFDYGVYPGSDIMLQKSSGEILFYGLYYTMTGLHGLHVIIGVVFIGIIMYQVWKGKIHSTYYVRLESAGLYWHLVDIIWIFLFPLFYLIT